MTRIRYVSDLHFEINGTVPNFITGVEGEVLVVAGDTTQADYFRPLRTDGLAIKQRVLFERFIDQVSDFTKVIFLMGNHEHYRGNIQASKALFEHHLYNVLKVSRDKFFVLENEFVEINKDTLLFGCTLWTDMGKNDDYYHYVVGRGMNDFYVIDNYNPNEEKPLDENVLFNTHDAVRLHTESVSHIKQFVDYNKNKNIIIATHHAPHYKSNGGEHVDSTITNGYCSDLSDLILDSSNIKYWIHGHVHSDVQYDIGGCGIRSFQRGYQAYGEGQIFNAKEFLNRYIEI